MFLGSMFNLNVSEQFKVALLNHIAACIMQQLLNVEEEGQFFFVFFYVDCYLLLLFLLALSHSSQVVCTRCYMLADE